MTGPAVTKNCSSFQPSSALSHDAAVESVAFGPAGVVANMRPGAIHISSSTISVALAQKLAAEHSAKSQGFISAPVFGRPEAADAAKLYVAVAGNDDAVSKCVPLLQAIGQQVFRFGEKPFLANLVKLREIF